MLENVVVYIVFVLVVSYMYLFGGFRSKFYGNKNNSKTIKAGLNGYTYNTEHLKYPLLTHSCENYI